MRALLLLLLLPGLASAQGATPVEGDVVFKDFAFTSGETVPELPVDGSASS